jgi:hypothetical protein
MISSEKYRINEDIKNILMKYLAVASLELTYQ